MISAMVRSPTSHPLSFLPRNGITVVGHRGARGCAPENTLPSLDLAVEQGAHMMEIDVQLSADGVPMVIHDATVDRTTNGTGAVRSMTQEELQQLDAGCWFVNPDGSRPFTGSLIPSLKEVLTRYPDTPITIELKAESGLALSDAVARVIEKTNRVHNVIVASDSLHCLNRFRRVQPEAVTSLARKEVATFYALYLAGLHRRFSSPGQLFQIPCSYYGIPLTTGGFIRAAHELGMHVQAWTVNEEDHIRSLIQNGVDGLVTDYPGKVLQVCEECQTRDGHR